MSVPEKKLNNLRRLLEDTCKQDYAGARHIASLIGKIISMGRALGPIARFMTKGLYATLQTSNAWRVMLELSADAKIELTFWKQSIEKVNGQPIWHSPSAVQIVYSDASNTGYGGYMVKHGMHVAQGNWLEHEAKQSSTWRELVAVGRVLQAIASKLVNVRVHWFTDNQNVVRILHIGSAKPHLQSEAVTVFGLCLANNIRLEPE